MRRSIFGQGLRFLALKEERLPLLASQLPAPLLVRVGSATLVWVMGFGSLFGTLGYWALQNAVFMFGVVLAGITVLLSYVNGGFASLTKVSIGQMPMFNAWMFFVPKRTGSDWEFRVFGFTVLGVLFLVVTGIVSLFL